MTPRGGSIVISMAKAGPDKVEFSVSDTGPGIAKERQARLFEKFHQLENGQERTGYGLGLYICRKIVELHTGAIRLESEPGRGSRFVFEIPRAQPAFSSSPG